MKTAAFILTLTLSAIPAFAQNNTVPATQPNQQPNSYNTQPANTGTYNTNYNNNNVNGQAPINVPQGGIMFSNKSGTVFSVDQLANQLRNLQSSIDQTLPALTAFNESFTGNSGESIGGALSNLVTSVLKKNNNTSSTQIPAAVTSLISAMRGQGNVGSTSIPANATKDLITLQNDLQPITGIFQDLNPGGATANPSQIISSPANAATTNGTPRNLAPTGR